MKEGIKLILRYFLAVIVWGLIVAGIIHGFFTLHGDSYCPEEIAVFISVFLSTIVASYCLPKEQRFHLGIVLSIWFAFFGLFLINGDLLYKAIPSALFASLFHYLRDIKLFIKYFLGAVLILFVLPFATGERVIEVGIIQLIGHFISADQNPIAYCVIFWISASAVYFGATLLGAYLLPSPHRLNFALFITIIGSLPRLVCIIGSLPRLDCIIGVSVINGGFWPYFGAIVFFGSFASGTIAAVLFLYWRQKLAHREADSTLKNP